jgi:hypothetical protein
MHDDCAVLGTNLDPAVVSNRVCLGERPRLGCGRECLDVAAATHGEEVDTVDGGLETPDPSDHVKRVKRGHRAAEMTEQ